MITVKVKCTCKNCLDLYKRICKKIDPDGVVKIGWEEGELQIYEGASPDIAKRLEAAFIGGEIYLDRTNLIVNQKDILESLKSAKELAGCVFDLRALISEKVLKPNDNGFDIVTKILEFEDKRSSLVSQLSNPLLSIEAYWDIMKEGMEIMLKFPDLQEQAKKVVDTLLED